MQRESSTAQPDGTVMHLLSLSSPGFRAASVLHRHHTARRTGPDNKALGISATDLWERLVLVAGPRALRRESSRRGSRPHVGAITP